MSKVDVHMSICEDLNELYARKNADYGDSFGKSFEEYGLTMACIRLEDKLNRIKALSKQDARVSDERIEDTLMDLANYAIMTLVELTRGEAKAALKKAHRGEHDIGCMLKYPECQCLTCVRDDCGRVNHHDNLCCSEHGFAVCNVGNCPDYVEEE